MRPRFSRFITLVAVAATFACGGEVAAPTTPAVVGTYTATTFTLTRDGTTLDELAEGVSLTITLAPDGTTSGSLDVPELPPISMAGTWSVKGDTVTFSQPVETFVRATPWRVTPGQLEGERGSERLTLRVILTR